MLILCALLQAGWKESHATFVKELKNLQALGLTTLGPALKQTFDLLNVNRMQSGIDTYGQVGCCEMLMIKLKAWRFIAERCSLL